MQSASCALCPAHQLIRFGTPALRSCLSYAACTARSQHHLHLLWSLQELPQYKWATQLRPAPRSADGMQPADRLLPPCAGHQRHLSTGSSSCSGAVCRHTPSLPHLALCCLLSCTWAISWAKQKNRQPDSLIKRIPEAAESLLIKISAHFRNWINSSKSNVSLLPNHCASSLGLLLRWLFTTSKSRGGFLSPHYHDCDADSPAQHWGVWAGAARPQEPAELHWGIGAPGHAAPAPDAARTHQGSGAHTGNGPMHQQHRKVLVKSLFLGFACSKAAFTVHLRFNFFSSYIF